VLKEHIQKAKAATNKPFGVNVPLLYPNVEEHMKTIIEEKVPIVFTSAGNPKTWTKHLQDHGIKVVHVVSSVKFALKSQEAGVDAIVAEGFEAGGHNGREETTTICLIPLLLNNVKIPIIAAGGIGSGSAMAAAFALGAEAVQIGSLFVATPESSAHQNFKNLIVDATDGATELSLKELTPVRLLKNKFYDDIQTAYNNKASVLQLKELLGRGRAKKGMFEGDLIEGELEIGQIASSITQVKPAALIVNEIWTDFKVSINNLESLTH
jgi:enoyl-[acyl-carrier protein] reductase II